MELQLVTFEQAKALKELGFPQGYDFSNWNNSYYDEDGIEYADCSLYGDYDFMTSAPTLELASKWVRENTGIFINVGLCVDFQYQVYLQTTLDKDHNIISSASQHSSYEEALSAGIDKTIEILKEDNYE